MRKTILFIIFSVISIVTTAQSYYPVNAIDSSLKQNAQAVIRYDSLSITVKSLNKAVISRKFAVTILDPAAAYIGDLLLDYGPEIKIKKISYNVYTKDGFLGKQIKKKEMDDFPVSNEVIFSEIRRKYVYVRYNTPYTVEYEYTISTNNLLQLPSWSPVTDFGVSLEKGVLLVEYPDDIPLKFKMLNYNFNRVKNEKDNIAIYKFSVENFKAVPAQYMTPEFYIFPAVMMTSIYFDYKGYKGNFKTWQDFGNWIYSLNQGRDELPEQTVNEIREKTADLNDIEKIKFVYNYVQNKTRYINIRFGLGDYQPLTAAQVDKLGYGDCKALTLYTQALLKAAGIKSYYALVKAGEDAQPILKDFPAQQFNHVILCVPLENDTVWLENTSKILPFNYLGTFTDNRWVLLIEKNNSKLVKTPVYDSTDNIFNEQIEISNINHLQRSAIVDIKFLFSGLFFEKNAFFLQLPKSKLKRNLEEFLPYNDFDIENFSVKQVRDKPQMEIKLKLYVRNLFKTSGPYSFYPVPFHYYFPKTVLQDTLQNYPVMLRRGFKISLNTIYNFGTDKADIKKLPPDMSFQNKVGSTDFSVLPDNNKILLQTGLSINPFFLKNSEKQYFYNLIKQYREINGKQIIIKSQ